MSANSLTLIVIFQDRSIDLCPIDHIDSDNSTVSISISSDSIKKIDVSIRVRIKGRGTDWRKGKDVK